MKKWMLWVLLSASTAVHAQQRTQEPTYPTILNEEARRFLVEFQNMVKYLADKGNPEADRLAKATAFSKKFKQGAKIEVLNGKKKTVLTPLTYFKRVIHLNYDKVNIDFQLRENKGVTSDGAPNKWKASFAIEQLFQGYRGGKVAYADIVIRVLDMHFVLVGKTWTPQMGNIRAEPYRVL
jgi:hypothetical protein